MLLYTTVDYSNIYSGPTPTLEELLSGIPSNAIIQMLGMINSELQDNEDLPEVQRRITEVMIQGFPKKEYIELCSGLARFEEQVGGNLILWGKRYVIDMMRYVFLHYVPGASNATTGDQEVRIIKAYLLLCEQMNEKDRSELEKVTRGIKIGDEFFFERLVWPFVLSQFGTNNKVNPVFEFFRLLGFIKHSLTDDEILTSWKRFIEYNDFPSLNHYLGSVHFLIKTTQYRSRDKDLKVFTWINSQTIPRHLLNLSFDVEEFKASKLKQTDYLGLRQKPLFESSPNRFIIIDINYLNNKIYNGPLFDMYTQTEMRHNTRFKSFPDFKTHIGTHVSEHIIFRGIIKKLFEKKNLIMHFDDDDKDGNPDCYIRWENKIFIIECKDYLFPGKLVESYSFDDIKSHLDLKFIKNENGANKGVAQIIEQIFVISTDKFPFDQFTSNDLTIYPVIIHTNFTYQMTGINYYLNNDFQRRLKERLPDLQYKVENLTLIDMETLFDLLGKKDITFLCFEKLICKYYGILRERAVEFSKVVSQENFVKARASFDEIYKTILYNDYEYNTDEKMTDVLMDAIKIDEKLLNAF